MQLSLNPKIFLILLFRFWNLHQILNILKKKLIVIATLFRKLKNVKNLVRPVSEKHRFKAPFDSQHVKGWQTLVKSAWEHFHHIFSSLWEKPIWKLRLVICYLLEVFHKSLTANEKYPARDCKNLSSPTQMQLPLKPKTFFILLFHFLNLHQILNILRKKVIVIATLFRKLQTVKDFDHYLKNTISKSPPTVNMLKGPKLL